MGSNFFVLELLGKGTDLPTDLPIFLSMLLLRLGEPAGFGEPRKVKIMSSCDVRQKFLLQKQYGGQNAKSTDQN